MSHRLQKREFFPNLGMFCSQPGNVSFPTWEIGFAASLVEEHYAPINGNV